MSVLIKRLGVIYGEPDSHDPKAYIAEIERLTKGYGNDIQSDAADHVISTHRYKSWPTPAQCVQACHLMAEEQASRQPSGRSYTWPSKRGPYDPVTLENWRKAKIWRDSLPDTHPLARQGNDHEHKMKPLFKALFEAMQRNSPNRELHSKPLTKRSRRMMGDDQ